MFLKINILLPSQQKETNISILLFLQYFILILPQTLLNSSQVRNPSLFLSILLKASSSLSDSGSGLTDPPQQHSIPPELDWEK
jgi:hypothetical protein